MKYLQIPSKVVKALVHYSGYRDLSESAEPELGSTLAKAVSNLNRFYGLALNAGMDLTEYVEETLFRLLLNEDLLRSEAPTGTQRLKLFSELIHVHTLFLEGLKQEAEEMMNDFCRNYQSTQPEQEGGLG